MAKTLVICCDGTANEFGPQNTNVVRLIQALDRDPTHQLLYYDPGVGTLPEPSTFTTVGKNLSMWFGLAFGGGIFWKVEQAYRYLMDFWEPDDRVFIFGFSRGAYTARLLAAVLHQMGLLPRGNHNLVPYVLRLFRSLPRDSSQVHNHFKLADEFRETFARIAVPGTNRRRFGTHFIGVWDTVSSVGFAWEPRSFPFTAHNPSVHTVRHAIAIDERRRFFRQNRMFKEGTQDLEERWFPGVHSDVGGGYPEAEGGLWRQPFVWLIDESIAAGLLVNSARLTAVLNHSQAPADPCLERKHESLTWKWWPLEFYPKLQWRPALKTSLPALGLGRRRFIHDGALIDRCALNRMRSNADYRPRNMSKEFIDHVKNLAIVPSCTPYLARP